MGIEELEKYKSRIEHRIKRNKSKINEYESSKDSLSIHGYWSLGYYIGIINELENLLDDINEWISKEV